MNIMLRSVLTKDYTLRKYQYQKIPEGLAIHPFVRLIWDEMNLQCVSQEDVAIRAGVNPGTIRKWRNGTRSPRLLELEAVMNVLGMRIVAHRILDDIEG